MKEKYFIKEAGNNVHLNCLSKIREVIDDGNAMVVVSNEKEQRSLQQNRCFHMWVKDIVSQTGESTIDVAGRCKLNYFVPVILNSTSDKKDVAIFKSLWATVKETYSYEKQVAILGASGISCTSILAVREFSEALVNMQFDEGREYMLRDPLTLGMRPW